MYYRIPLPKAPVYIHTSISRIYRSLFSYSVQLLSPVRLFAIPWTAEDQATLSITNSWSLLKLMSLSR